MLSCVHMPKVSRTIVLVFRYNSDENGIGGLFKSDNNVCSKVASFRYISLLHPYGCLIVLFLESVIFPQIFYVIKRLSFTFVIPQDVKNLGE